jgi:amino acid adenylation domain-containing protein/non-ribosomal peptide synthase protein (TIGR01720 family)
MADISATYPLSPLQQGMLYHALSQPRSGVDMEQLVLTLPEPIDADRLRAAWAAVVLRHPILRTAFSWSGEEARQQVYSEVKLPFSEEDLSALPEDDKATHLENWLRADRQRGFAMDVVPLQRWHLFRWGAADFRLVWTFHHALLDGRSFPLVLDEVFARYDTPDAPEPATQRPYADFIAWHQARDLGPSESHWRAKLAGFRAPTQLAVDSLPDVTEAHGQADAQISLEADVTYELRAAAEHWSVTVNTLVQGAWAILLSRYSGEADVCFGATRAGRAGTIEGADAMVGLFINTVPVRVQVENAAPLGPWLSALRQQWVDVRPHEHTPLARVQAWSEVPPGKPLFRSLVVFENYDLATHFREREGAWARRSLRLHEQTNFPICLAAYAGKELRLVAEYDRGIFSKATIARLLGHLANLLRGLTTRPATLGDLSLLPSEERAELITNARQTAPVTTPSTTLHQLFSEQAARTPGATALLQGDVRVSYAELEARANVVAQHLRANGIGAESIVGLCLERTPELVVALLGILKANAAYLPIDLAYPPERLAFMLADAQAPVLLTQRHLADRLPPGYGARLLCIEDLAHFENPAPLPAGDPAQLCYVLYTSGSTGQPKGCCVTHHNVLRLFTATEPWFGFGPADVWTLFHSTAFDFSVWELWGALLHGGTLVVVPFEVSRSPEQFHTLLAREKVTVLNQTPSAFRQLMAADATCSPPPDLALRYVIFGGEALEMSSLQPWFQRHGDARPQLVNMYGITETTVHVTYRPLRASDTQRGSVIGQPIPDLQLHILDNRLDPAPIGVPGELFVGGAGLARGYLRRPELTAERFIESLFAGGERLYRTGDLARRLPDGDLEYLGRIDHQVKIRGFRIELGEIETVLLRHPKIRGAALLAREDAAGGKRLVAWLIADGEPPATAELRTHLKALLPDYMVPAAFVFVEAMPLTANGKLDTRALPDPAEHRPDLATGYVAPRNDREATLAAIWQRVLKLKQVGIHDHFFELGGDSILSIIVVSQARQAGLPFTPKQLFDHPTIAELAAAATPAETPRLADLPRLGEVPLTPIQRWFFAHDFADAQHWNQSLTAKFTQPFTREQIAAALDVVLAAHPVFALHFERRNDQWHQEFRTTPRGETCLLPAGENPQTALRLNGRLLACALEENRLTIAIHHLIVDGVSWRILLGDLDAALRGVPASEETTGFHTWAHALTRASTSPVLLHEQDYWHHLTPDATLAQLPLDKTEEQNTEASAETFTVQFSPEETARLLSEFPQRQVTIQEALLAALAQALRAWTARPETLIELEGHGREEAIVQNLAGDSATADLSRTVGWFTTIYPHLLRAADRPEDTLAQVRRDLAAVPNKGLGYALLHAQDLMPAPPAQVLFNYLGQFDAVTDNLTTLRLAGFSTEGWHAPSAQRTHLLEINSLILDGALQIRWTFSHHRHEPATISRLAENFAHALRTLLAAGSSRFPLAKIDAAPVLSRYPNLEDLHPLSPMQRLFLTLETARPGSGSDQWHCRLLGPLDAPRLRTAWAQVLHHFPALRTAYLADGEPHAAVLADAEPEWHEEDWRGLPIGEQDRKFSAFLAADAARPFDLARAPLTRLALFRVSESEHRFVWTHHHLEIDGWSWPLVFRAISAFYAREGIPEVRPYRDYIAWLAERPSSESFWREMLRGFSTPTPLPASPAPASAEVEVSLDLPATLAETARNLQVTPAALVQAAWSILLGHHAQSDDTIFGAALAGRPPELPGSEDIAGHFVNNLPVRARLAPEATFRTLAQTLHRQLAAISEHQYSALTDLHGWSELPWNARLFSTLLVFQNYQGTAAAQQLDDVGIAELHAPVRTNYPLTLVINPGEPGTATLIAQPRTAALEAVRGLLQQLVQLLAAANTPDALLADIARLLPTPPSAPTSATPFSPPPIDTLASALEQQVTEVWREAFDRSVGATENFFDVGGHSLLMLQVHRRLVARLGRELPIVKLFQYPTIRALARYLGGDAAPAPQTMESAPKLTAVQERAAKARAALARPPQRIRTK